MYYEAIEHKVKDVNSAKEAAELIKAGKVNGYEAIKWTSINGTFYAVSDVHIDSPDFFETAIIKEDENNFRQVESITVGWCDLKRTIECFEQSETANFGGPTQLIIGKAKTGVKAWFECGCCGEGFKGELSYQKKFDQDAGYGICPACEHYY